MSYTPGTKLSHTATHRATVLTGDNVMVTLGLGVGQMMKLADWIILADGATIQEEFIPVPKDGAAHSASGAEFIPLPPWYTPKKLKQCVHGTIFTQAEMESAKPLCDICQIQISEKDALNGLCNTCCERIEDGMKHYAEEFALASVHGKDAVRLFVLRQRADHCREICDTYHCDKSCCESLPILPEVQEAKRDEELMNKLAAECLARLPASFAPWWRDAWTEEKWWELSDERHAMTTWPLPTASAAPPPAIGSC
jgi:hypothetical protein